MRKLPQEYENPLDFSIGSIAIYILPYLHKFGATPNIITILSFTLGILCAYSYSSGNYMTSAILYTLSYFFDNVDGLLARKYKMTSEFGDFLDHFSDAIKSLFIFYGIFTNASIPSYIRIQQSILLTVLFVAQTIHIGCQEKYYKQNNTPSSVLSHSQNACRDPAKLLTISRFFGCGTFNFVVVLVILSASLW